MQSAWCQPGSSDLHGLMREVRLFGPSTFLREVLPLLIRLGKVWPGCLDRQDSDAPRSTEDKEMLLADIGLPFSLMTEDLYFA